MQPVTCVVVIACCLLAWTSAQEASSDSPSTDAPSTDAPNTDAPSTDAPSTDITDDAKEFVTDIRNVVEGARDGILLRPFREQIDQLRQDARNLLYQLPITDIECETNAVLKLAAAATSSHEVMTLLFARDNLALLNGRLELSLAVLEHIALQVREKLALSNSIGAQLSAVMLLCNTTEYIIDLAEVTVTKSGLLAPGDMGQGWRYNTTSGVSWGRNEGRMTLDFGTLDADMGPVRSLKRSTVGKRDSRISETLQSMKRARRHEIQRRRTGWARFLRWLARVLSG